MTRQELSAATDRLSELLTAAEGLFRDRNHGVSACVKLDLDDKFLKFLWWSKIGSEWQLHVDGRWIHEVGRELRVAAALALPELLSQLQINESGLASKMKEAISKAERFLSAQPESEG